LLFLNFQIYNLNILLYRVHIRINTNSSSDKIVSVCFCLVSYIWWLMTIIPFVNFWEKGSKIHLRAFNWTKASRSPFDCPVTANILHRHTLFPISKLFNSLTDCLTTAGIILYDCKCILCSPLYIYIYTNLFTDAEKLNCHFIFLT